MRFNSSVKKFISVLPLLIILFVVLGYGLSFSTLGVLKGVAASETGIEESSMNPYFVVMGVCTLVYFFVFSIL